MQEYHSEFIDKGSGNASPAKTQNTNLFERICTALENIHGDLQQLLGYMKPVVVQQPAEKKAAAIPSATGQRVITCSIEGDGIPWKSGKGYSFRVVATKQEVMPDGAKTKYLKLMVNNRQAKCCADGAMVSVVVDKITSDVWKDKTYYTVFATLVEPVGGAFEPSAEDDAAMTNNDNFNAEEDVPF